MCLAYRLEVICSHAGAIFLPFLGDFFLRHGFRSYSLLKAGLNFYWGIDVVGVNPVLYRRVQSAHRSPRVPETGIGFLELQRSRV